MVRGDTVEGQKVEKLHLEAYEEKADEVLGKICDDLTQKPGIINVQIHHLLGEFNVGDDLVYVAVAGSHRTRSVHGSARSRREVQKRSANLQKRTRNQQKRRRRRILGFRET